MCTSVRQIKELPTSRLQTDRLLLNKRLTNWQPTNWRLTDRPLLHKRLRGRRQLRRRQVGGELIVLPSDAICERVAVYRTRYGVTIFTEGKTLFSPSRSSAIQDFVRRVDRNVEAKPSIATAPGQCRSATAEILHSVGEVISHRTFLPVDRCIRFRISAGTDTCPRSVITVSSVFM